MQLETCMIRFDAGGEAFEGYLAWDAQARTPAPSVLVGPTWMGRNVFTHERAERLVELGYVGFAYDIYGAGKGPATAAEARDWMMPLVKDRDNLNARLSAAMDVLQEQPQVDATKIAAIGFCFGGLTSLDLARTRADLSAAVSFHGLLGAPENIAALDNIKAKVLALHGWDDPLVPPAAVLAFADEMTRTQTDWQLHAYGHTAHAFTNPEANQPGDKMYSAAADRRSWQAMTNFLAEVL